MGGHIIKEIGKITIEHPQNCDIATGITVHEELPIKIYGSLEDGTEFCLTILAIATQLSTYKIDDKSKICCFDNWRYMNSIEA